MVDCCFVSSQCLDALYLVGLSLTRPGLVRWFGLSVVVEGGSRVVAPAGEVLFFASPKKSTQKKGDPQSATPSLRDGATCVGAVAGCAVELALRCARRSDNHGESVNDAGVSFGTPAHPATTRRRRSQQG
ncbi:hypothetical protein CBP35_14070 [Acidovorax carolinensis]|nr:hypothetical protein CBP35_14070 [Acidovorax carolinensis]